MSETYTVQNAMKSGKSSNTYGDEYYTKFVESEQTFPLWFKKDPTGTKINGTINGSKFVKDKTPPAEQKQTSAPNNRGRYDSDGQRQGMAINNAAAYVLAMATELVPPDMWAQTVIGYAKALYKAADLNGESEPVNMTGVFKDNKDA